MNLETLTQKQVLRYIALSKFEPVTERERLDSLCGIESDDALVCYGDDYIIVIDSDLIQFIDPDSGGFTSYSLLDLDN